MKFRTIILSRQANKIAEMLPGSSSKGWVCLHESSDLPAAQTAIGLVKARAIMFTPSLAIVILLICASVSTVCFYQIGIDAGMAAASQSLRQEQLSLNLQSGA